MYNFLTAFVTTGVAVFLAIYNTHFIPVVTLGGTVLGSAMIGFASALLSLVLHRFLGNGLLRYGSEIVGCSCIITAVIRGLPGWDLKPEPGALLFMLVMCVMVTLINEYTLNENFGE